MSIDRPCFALYGDSNMANAYGFSYHERALAKRYPSMRVCAAGGGVGAAAIAGSPIASLVSGCNILVYAMGTNNLATPAATLIAAIAADLEVFRRRGIRYVIGCTLPPQTSSDEGDWSTVAGQTPHPEFNGEVNRLAVNAAWRNGTLERDAVCDATTFVEVDATGAWVRDGGRWQVVGGEPFGDNVHFRDLGHQAASVGQAETMDRLIAGERDFVVDNPLLVA